TVRLASMTSENTCFSIAALCATTPPTPPAPMIRTFDMRPSYHTADSAGDGCGTRRAMRLHQRPIAELAVVRRLLCDRSTRRIVMKIVRMIALGTLIAVAAGALTGCIVEARRPYWPHHHHVFWR